MSKGFSLETIKALTGRTIIRVGEKGLHLDNGKAIYLSDDEIESLNYYHEPPEVEKPKGRYLIRFSERVDGAKEHEWKHISTEDYEERVDVTRRFNEAVAVSHNDVASIHILVIDTKRLQYEIPDEEILCYTKLVD